MDPELEKAGKGREDLQDDEIRPEPRVGIYLCHCGLNIASKVHIDEAVRFAASLPGVVAAREYKFMCSDPGQELIKEDIRSGRVNRVVVASCSPLMHESTFRKAAETAGLNPFLFQMASIREHVSWVTADETDATRKACVLIAAAVSRVKSHEVLEKRKVKVRPEVLVVGAGIAGISAALPLADSGRKVYLVEREPSIGGNMSRFDKTFPTLDCSSCILTPRMTQAGSHPNIALLSYSEVAEVSGSIGDFKVKVRRKPRYVDGTKCNACGECVKVCPVSVPSEFDLGLSRRTAIYRSFPQAVPGTFTIDKRKTSPCSAECPAGIPAHAYVALTRAGRHSDAFRRIAEATPLVATLGRTCPATCQAKCTHGEIGRHVSIRLLKRFLADLQANKKLYAPIRAEPTDRKVAVVGAGPAGLTAAFHLSREGHEVTVYDAASKPGGTPALMIPEFRLPAAAMDQDIDLVKEAGVRFVTGRKVTREDIGRFLAGEADAVLVATGAMRSRRMGIPGEDLAGVVDSFKFLSEVKKRNQGCSVLGGGGIPKAWRGTSPSQDPEQGESISLSSLRVLVVGGGNAAVDSARTAIRLGARSVTILYRRSRAEMPAWNDEIEATEQEGVALRLLAAPIACLGKDKLEAVKVQPMRLGEPDASGRPRPIPVPGKEETLACDVLIAAIGADADASDLAPDGADLDNGRLVIDLETGMTGLQGLFAAGDAVIGPSTIAEAAGSGTRAAKGISKYLQNLIPDSFPIQEGEKQQDLSPPEAIDSKEVLDRIGTIEDTVPMPHVFLPPDERKKSFIEAERGFSAEEAAGEAGRCLDCSVCSACLSCVEKCEPKAIDFGQEERIEEIEVGAIIVATGFQPFDPSILEDYGFRKLPNVRTSMEVERLSNATGPTQGQILLEDGTPPRSVAILHCIGSRDRLTHEYCSRVCCMASLKLAHLVHEKSGAEVTSFYIDMRTFGKGYEEFYHRVMEEGVRFVRGKGVEVAAGSKDDPDERGRLVVRAENTLSGGTIRQAADMVILAVAMEPRADALQVARTFGLSLGKDGFLLERHPKLGPAGTFMDGVFIAGAVQGPKDIVDTVSHAGAAGHEALSLVSRGEVEIDPITSRIDPDLCAACGQCVEACVFKALSLDDTLHRAVVNEALCKGCGLCAAICPSGAADQRHFTGRALCAEVTALIHM